MGGDDGKYHWVGDSRALVGGKPVLRGPPALGDRDQSVRRLEHKGTIGDPYLSAPLLMGAGDMYLPKWEQDQAQPTLLHIKSIDDVRVFGVKGATYVRCLIKQAPDWEAQTGLRVARAAGGRPRAGRVRERARAPRTRPPPSPPRPGRPRPGRPRPR